MRFLALVFLASRLMPAQQVLQLGSTVQKELSPNEKHQYNVRLADGESANLSAKVDQGLVFWMSYDPSGEAMRRFPLPVDTGGKLSIIAQGGGHYRLDLLAGCQGFPWQACVDGKSARYSITLDAVLSIDQRASVAPTGRDFASPRVEALQRELARGNRAALDQFWAQVGREGTPLVEQMRGDDAHQLVTFLWRAVNATRTVLVDVTPQATNRPQDWMMNHIANTDVWHKTAKLPRGSRFTYRLAPNVFPPRPRTAIYLEYFFDSGPTAQADPLNPKRVDASRGTSGNSSIAELPGAVPQPWHLEQPGVARGKIEETRFNSSVYTPAGYRSEGETYPILILHDRSSTIRRIQALTILDNLIAAKKIAPLIAVLLDNEERDTELSCNKRFAEFIRSELLPWMRRSYHVTSDSRKVFTAGSSLGGLSAACEALFYPETFGNVIAMSGSFWYRPGASPGGPSVQTSRNWVAEQFAGRPMLPIRFWLAAGWFEVDYRGTGVGQVLEPTRHLRDVLKAKGYDVQLQEFAGDHGFLNWRGSLADALIALVGR